MKNKSFDCVEMKRKGAELVQQRVASLTKAQQLEYQRKGTLVLKQEVAVPGAPCVMEATSEYGEKQFDVDCGKGLSDIHKPIGVSEYQLTQSLPENLKSSLPSIEEIEAELSGERDE